MPVRLAPPTFVNHISQRDAADLPNLPIGWPISAASLFQSFTLNGSECYPGRQDEQKGG
jgi:hypothetical protein